VSLNLRFSLFFSVVIFSIVQWIVADCVVLFEFCFLFLGFQLSYVFIIFEHLNF
jgi:uncharacterized membrane protein